MFYMTQSRFSEPLLNIDFFLYNLSKPRLSYTLVKTLLSFPPSKAEFQDSSEILPNLVPH